MTPVPRIGWLSIEGAVHHRWLLTGCRVATAVVCTHLAIVASLVGSGDRALWGIAWCDTRWIGPVAAATGVAAIVRPHSDRLVQVWVGLLTIAALGRTYTTILIGSTDFTRAGELRTASAWFALWVCAVVVAIGMWTMATLADYEQRAHVKAKAGDL